MPLDHVEPPRLFVYGTLQPGRLRWPFLEPFVIGHRSAFVAGTLYDSGHGWPVAVFAVAGAEVEVEVDVDVRVGDETAGLVPGVLVDLDPDQLPVALQVIDDVEATATDLLRRIVVVTTAGDPAWTYHCPHPTDVLTRIARWDGFPER